MRIRDLRRTVNLAFPNAATFPKRALTKISEIVIHQTEPTCSSPQKEIDGDSKNYFHYLVLKDGEIEYLHNWDMILSLEGENALEVALEGNFDQNIPSFPQLKACADLIAFLLVERPTTPHLGKEAQIIPHCKIQPNLTCPGKTFSQWQEIITGQKSLPRPDLLAEYRGQKVILPQQGKISFKVTFLNTGVRVWQNKPPNLVKLNVCWEGDTSSARLWRKYQITKGSSIFKDSSWQDDFCPCILKEEKVRPQEEGTFIFTLAGNGVDPGLYREDFGLAFGDQWVNNYINGNQSNKAHCWFEIEIV